MAADDLRLAFFITSYGPGPQLLRLVRTLRIAEPSSPIVIHHDEFQSALDTAAFTAIDDVHILTSDHPIVWGDMTLDAARWRVFRWILGNLDADWVMLLSEQDYPIAPLSTLRRRFADDGVDVIMLGERIAEIADPVLRRECRLRYHYRYVSLPSLGVDRRLPASWREPLRRLRGLMSTAVVRLQDKVFIYLTPPALGLPTRVGLRQRRTPFSADFPCWYNDCWFAISRKGIEHLLGYLDSNPGFVRYYQRTVIPLESATATILFNDPGLTVSNVGLHAIRWTDPSSGRPDVFSLDDLDFLLSSGLPFARKFDAADTDILDGLDRIVLSDSQGDGVSASHSLPRSGSAGFINAP